VSAIALDNTQFIALQYLICRKTRLAIKTFPATADSGSVFGETGVNDLIIEGSTFRAAHICCVDARIAGKITTRYSEVNFIFSRSIDFLCCEDFGKFSLSGRAAFHRFARCVI
jgi:hypothetical protein